MLCVASLSCDLRNSFASSRNIAEYTLLLRVMSLLDSTSQFCKPSKLINGAIKTYSCPFPIIFSNYFSKGFK